MKSSIAFLLLFLISMASFSQESNKLDDKGLRHGLWKGIHEESKRPRYEGTFDHGKETGVFKYFDDTKAGSVIATRVFAKDGSCYTTVFDQKGNKVSEGREVNKLHEGEWKFYHKESKDILAIEKYAKGKLTGKRKVFYAKNVLNEETEYVNGVRHGPYKKYTEKGVLLEDVIYKNGELNGPAVFKNENDQLIAKGTFVNGRKMGMWQFFEDGKLIREENLSNPRNKQIKA